MRITQNVPLKKLRYMILHQAASPKSERPKSNTSKQEIGLWAEKN